MSLLIPATWGGALHQDSPRESLTADYIRLDLDRVFFVTPFVTLLIEELTGLPQALAELGRLDLKYLGVTSDRQTGGVSR